MNNRDFLRMARDVYAPPPSPPPSPVGPFTPYFDRGRQAFSPTGRRGLPRNPDAITQMDQPLRVPGRMKIYDGKENYQVDPALAKRTSGMSAQELMQLYIEDEENRDYVGTMFWSKHLEALEAELPNLRRGEIDAFHGRVMGVETIPMPDKATVSQVRWYASLGDEDLPAVSEVVRVANNAAPPPRSSTFKPIRQ